PTRPPPSSLHDALPISHPATRTEHRMIADDLPERLTDRLRAADQAAEDTEALDPGLPSCEESEVLDPLCACALGKEARGARYRNQHLRVGASPRGDVGSREKLPDRRTDASEDGHDGRNDAGPGQTYRMHCPHAQVTGHADAKVSSPQLHSGNHWQG